MLPEMLNRSSRQGLASGRCLSVYNHPLWPPAGRAWCPGAGLGPRRSPFLRKVEEGTRRHRTGKMRCELPWEEERGPASQGQGWARCVLCVLWWHREDLCPRSSPSETYFCNSLRNRCLRICWVMQRRVNEGCEWQGRKSREISGQGESQAWEVDSQ